MGFEWHVEGFFSDAFVLIFLLGLAGIAIGALHFFSQALSRDGTLPGDEVAVRADADEKEPTFAGYRDVKRPPPPTPPRLREAPLSVRIAAFGLYATPWLWPALQWGAFFVCAFDDERGFTASEGFVSAIPFCGVPFAMGLFWKATRTFARGSARAVPSTMRLAAAVATTVYVVWAAVSLTSHLTSVYTRPLNDMRTAVLAIVPIGLAHAALLFYASFRVPKTTAREASVAKAEPAAHPFDPRAQVRFAIYGLRAAPFTWLVLSLGVLAVCVEGEGDFLMALFLPFGFLPAFLFFRRTDLALRERDFDAVERDGGRAWKISLLVCLLETLSALFVTRRGDMVTAVAALMAVGCLNIAHALCLWYTVVMARLNARRAA